VLKKLLYFVGRTVNALMLGGACGVLAVAYGGPAAVQNQAWVLFGVLFLAVAAGVVVHELGHLLACLAVGAKVKEFRLGGEQRAIRFHVRTVKVSLGWPYQGRVQYDGALSRWRQAVVTLAGSFADLAFAGLALAVGSATAASGQSARPLVVAAVLGFGVLGLSNLMPFRTRSGRLSDGARLLELPFAARTAQLLAVRKKATRLLREGRAEELLELHAGLDVPAGRMGGAEAAARIFVEFNVVFLTGLPDDAAHLAERRVEMLMRHADLSHAKSMAHLTLAVLRLRRGGQADYAAAELLCDQALTVTGIRDSVRRMALPALIVSRQARGLPVRDIPATAAATLQAEMMAEDLKAILDPEGTLLACRQGDPAALLGVGSIAVFLRRQGRIGELLELHARLRVPAGRYARGQAQSAHAIECSLLLVPGLPSEVINEAALRVQWIVDNYPFKRDEENSMPRPAVEHTLALARLRQGRFGEVEPLCASGLAADHGPDTRATIVATIALARRALGQPHADLLAEAVALSPNADLVAEATGLVPIGPRAFGGGAGSPSSSPRLRRAAGLP
jgi:hypothetical protein